LKKKPKNIKVNGQLKFRKEGSFNSDFGGRLRVLSAKVRVVQSQEVDRIKGGEQRSRDGNIENIRRKTEKDRQEQAEKERRLQA
jgi:hypothetical protein